MKILSDLTLEYLFSKDNARLYSQKNVLEYIQSQANVDLNELLQAFSTIFKVKDEDIVNKEYDEKRINEVVGLI